MREVRLQSPLTRVEATSLHIASCIIVIEGSMEIPVILETALEPKSHDAFVAQAQSRGLRYTFTLREEGDVFTRATLEPVRRGKQLAYMQDQGARRKK